jgi:hypothetical protein
MSGDRAQRILRALRWPIPYFCRNLNRIARTNYKAGDISRWFANGRQPIPHTAALFLRMEMRSTFAGRQILRELWDQDIDR